MEYAIRSAVMGDAAALLAIYAPYVTDTCVSFEESPPSPDAFAGRLRESLDQYAWLVCEVRREIVGYAYATAYRARAAYRYSASTSVYIKVGYHRQGIGHALYEALFERLKTLGIYTLVAGIALPNPASVGLHKAMGFAEVGVYRSVGYKFGRWQDTLALQKALRVYDTPADKA
ncbi:MAG: N-acetyltransferase [Firmicutes bacterium]|nr:N-acetyltransferase [Bacillota bacterium]